MKTASQHMHVYITAGTEAGISWHGSYVGSHTAMKPCPSHVYRLNEFTLIFQGSIAVPEGGSELISVELLVGSIEAFQFMTLFAL